MQTPQFIFTLIIGILVVNFLIDKYLDWLNAQRFDDPIPEELNDVYDQDRYLTSQRYKKVNFKFAMLTSVISFIATIAFFYFEGFAYVDGFARSVSSNEIVIALVFFGSILIASDLLSLPLAYYKTFVIEEKFGFNKTTVKTAIGKRITVFITKHKLFFLFFLPKSGFE